MLLQFRAEKLHDPKTCDVDCWIFPRLEADSVTPGYPLRDALYRFLVQGLRRRQSEGIPLPAIGNLQAASRAFYSGEPLWRHADGKKHRSHPEGYVRDTDDSGSLCWKFGGEWASDPHGRRIPDSYALWTNTSATFDEDIYSAN